MSRTIVEKNPENIAIIDVFSRLIQDRIIFIGEVIDDYLSNEVIAQMLYLDSKNTKDPINVYINTPGGSVPAGLAIYDVANLIKAPIITTALGTCASMGVILLLMGSKRYATKHTRLMAHQPSGGVIGTASEIGITYEEIQKYKKYLYDIIESKTNINNSEELFKNDYWMSAEEALGKGFITKIL